MFSVNKKCLILFEYESAKIEWKRKIGRNMHNPRIYHKHEFSTNYTKLSALEIAVYWRKTFT